MAGRSTSLLSGPNPNDSLAERLKPQSRPGTLVHGVHPMADGGTASTSSVGIGLVRMDACGGVLWRLPHRTYHSIFVAEDGTFWVPAAKSAMNR